MRIVVLAKQVPDTYGSRQLSLQTGLAEREAGENVLDEISERALEAAIGFAETTPAVEVVALSMGPSGVSTALRKALAMGATRAVHLLDEELVGADLRLTSIVLAAAVQRIGFDLVLAGNMSSDGSAGVLPAMLAERLGTPHATNMATLEIGESEVRGRRESDYGTIDVAASLPAVVSVTERMPDARLPNFKGILAAKKKQLEVLSLEDLGCDVDHTVPQSIMLSADRRGQRSAGVKIVDDGHAGERIAQFLVQNRLA